MSGQREIPETIVHTPIRPVRVSVIGEVVFTERWQELMASMPNDWSPYDDPHIPIELSYLHDIVRSIGLEADQRAAHVAASLICWLGTNSGRGFLNSIERYRQAHGWAAGLVAWSLENAKRGYGVNHGIRTLEHLLATPDCLRTRPVHITTCPLVKIPELSVRDYEIADAVAMWLGNAGHGFVVGCEREIRRQEDFKNAMQLAKFQSEVNGRVDFEVTA